MQILDLAVRHVVPFTMGRSKVRIWDAGCAMGPEPYSLAILFAESMGHFAFKNLTVYATDIDETDTFGTVIRNGIYPEDELKRIPEGIFRKYFKTNGKPGFYEVTDLIRKRITFLKHDLLSLQPIGSDFSLIVCKNVLLHFQPHERREVIQMFHRSLTPGGYLAMEQTQKMPRESSHLYEQIASDGQVFKKVNG